MNTDNIQKKYICACGKKLTSKQALVGHYANCQAHKDEMKLKQMKEQEEKEAKRLPNGMFICENPHCQKEHSGNYGSGRFCSKECAAHVCALNSAKTAKQNGTIYRRYNFKKSKVNNGRAAYGT